MWNGYWLTPSFRTHLKLPMPLYEGISLLMSGYCLSTSLGTKFSDASYLFFCQVLSLPAAQGPQDRCPATTRLCRARP